MSTNLPEWRYRLYDNATGLPLAGAKLFFYDANTTVDRAVYTESDLAVAHPQPVVADANGYFPQIFLTPKTPYRVIAKTSADVTIFDVLSFYPVTLDDSTLLTLFKGVTTPYSYNNAKGDGVANEAAAVQAAIDAAVHTVDLLGGRFRCDSGLTLKSGVRIVNGTLDFSNVATSVYITAAGTRGGGVAAANTGTAGTSTWNVGTVTGIAPNDWVYASDTQSGGNGEIVQVSSVSAPNLNFRDELRGTYLSVSAAQYQKLTTVTDVVLENLRIIGSIAHVSTALLLDVAERCRVKDCRFENVPFNGITVRMCIDTRIERCTFRNGSTNAAADAVRISESARDTTVSDCQFDGCRRAVRAGLTGTIGGLNPGITRNTLVRDCRVGSAPLLCVEVLPATQDTVIERCQLRTAGLNAVIMQGYSCTVRDCDIVDGGNVSVDLTALPVGLSGVLTATAKPVVRNNRIGTVLGGAAINATLANCNDADFSYNDIDASAGAILVTAQLTSLIKRLRVSGNRCSISSGGTNADIRVIHAVGTPTTSVVTGVEIDENTVEGRIQIDLRLTAGGVNTCEDISVSRNAITCGQAVRALELTQGLAPRVDNNRINITSAGALAAIYVGPNTGSTIQAVWGGSISDNTVRATGVTPAIAAIQVSDALGTVIARNRVLMQSGGTAPAFTNSLAISGQCSTLQINDNYFNGTGAAITHSGGFGLPDTTFRGNHLYNTSTTVPALSLANSANYAGMVISGNRFLNSSSGTMTLVAVGSGSANLNGLSVTGNHFRKTAGVITGIAIAGATLTNTIHDGNAFDVDTNTSGVFATAGDAA